MFKKRKPLSPAKLATAMSVAVEKGAERKNRTLMSGSAQRRSHATSTTNATSERAKTPKVDADDHP